MTGAAQHARRRLSAACLGLLLAAGLGGCSGTAGQSADPAPGGAGTPASEATAEATGTSGRTPASNPARTPARTYVALGDSYTAAPLVPETETETGCFRSSGNYPSLVAAELPGYELVDVSCVGARSASLVGAQRTVAGVQPPQFAALDRGTDLVTVSIGGNDDDLFTTLIAECGRLARRDPTGAPCRAAQRRGGEDRLRRAVASIEGRIAAVVAGVRDRAPRAEVLVVGYPQVLPATGRCPERLPLADGDYAYARRLFTALVDGMAVGAERSDAAYVDAYAATRGHDVCADDPWVNGRITDPDAALAFHPFAAGQRAVADRVLALL